MKKTYIQPEAKVFTVKTENLMEMSAGFGEPTGTQYSKENGQYVENDGYFGW